MMRIICIIYFLVVVFLTIECKADEIWKESFSIPDKGFWGDSDGTSLNSDMESIINWNIDVAACQLTAETDYVKTTSTSGGRFEAMDSDGEAVWTSERISIEDFKNISLKVNVSETGSGANVSSKYVRLYFQVDDSDEILFETNGENAGNFGSNQATQSISNGESLRIVIRMNSCYSSDKLIIDEVLVEGDPIVSFSENRISEVTILDETSLKISFIDEIDPLSVGANSFLLQNEYGNSVPITNVSLFDQSNKNIVVITVAKTEVALSLVVTGIRDISGLFLKPETIDLVWIVPCMAQSIVINEIMADPFPSVLLPEYEYIELLNRTSSPVHLKQLKLEIDSKTYSLPDSIIGADDYVVLVSPEAAEYFPKAVAIAKFPALKNSMATVSIITNLGVTIDEIQYSDEWYGNEQLKDGGRSLERIDPDRFCGQENNWTASENANGGTPGLVNSVKRRNVDQFPAKIVFLDVAAPNRLDVYFSEQIDADCISNRNNYLILGTTLLPDSISVVSEKQVSLFYSENFCSKINYTLEMLELIDQCGNYSINKSGGFVYYEPEEHCLVITELFADPYPSVGLSEYEYIEIFNRSEYPIPLNNIRLFVESKGCALGNNTILPHEYLVFTSIEGADLMPQSLGVVSFPSIRNSSGKIQLVYNDTRIIDQLEYLDGWHENAEKLDGGWSLERIDNNRFCGMAGNWTSSKAELGGTPGEPNSVAADNQDSTSPLVVELEVLSSTKIKLLFSEDISEASLLAKENYLVSSNIGYPTSMEYIGKSGVILIFSESFVPNYNYSLQLSGIADECGNAITENTQSFELVKLDEGDVLISEVLFNPYSGGADFVEIYNHSDKNVNLRNLWIATRDEQSELKELCKLSEKNRWVQPDEYVLCTKDSAAVALFYYTSCPDCFCEMDKFPTYSDDGGNVVLLDDSLLVLDEFQYSEKMHHSLIADCEGVSLERLSDEVPASDLSNWHSAASSVGFATPGYPNSQHRNLLLTKENIVLDPEVFSPNNDGYNDRLLIHYQLEDFGYSANVKIFDSMGRLVNHLVKNEILAQQGEWHWDGERTNNARSGLGIYIVFVELCDTQGHVRKYKKTCTLTDRL